MPILSADALEQLVITAVFQHAAEQAPGQLLQELSAALQRTRATLLEATRLVDEELQESASRRDWALDMVADKSLSPTLRQAFVERAEEAVQAYAALQVRRRTLELGIETLDARARSISLALGQEVAVDRWREPAVYEAIRRALHLLIHRAILREVQRGTYVIDLQLYTIEGLIGREFDTGGGAWESNPPAPLVTPPSDFEDREGHRAPSTPAGQCS
jgi:hypothetical protein